MASITQHLKEISFQASECRPMLKASKNKLSPLNITCVKYFIQTDLRNLQENELTSFWSLKELTTNGGQDHINWYQYVEFSGL